MKKIAILTAAGLAAAGLGTTAFAGSLDAPAIEPVIAPVEVVAPPSVGGDWGGGYVGAQLGYGDVNSTGTALEGDGALGGVHAGYNFDLGNYVLGAEVDWDKANIDLSNGAGSLDSVARLKLKGGFDLGRTLVYATAGGAQAYATVGGVERDSTGYFGGLGLSYAVTQNWIVGGEVLSHRFEDFDNTGIDLDATTLTARASFRF